MTPLVDTLKGLAFASATPAEANVAIAKARADFGGEQDAVSYEIALPALDPDGFLARQALPKLVYFLDCRGVRVPANGGVFVSLFTSEGLYFVDAGAFAVEVGRTLGLDGAALHGRYGERGTGDPKLLGP